MELLTVNEIADSAHVCAESVRRLKRRGVLVPVRVIGCSNLFTADAVEIARRAIRPRIGKTKQPEKE